MTEVLLSTASAVLPVEDVSTQVSYLDQDHETELYFYLDPTPGQLQTNVKTGPFDVEIKDLRTRARNFTLDSAGFQIVDDSKHDPEYALFDNNDRITTEYYKQIEEILKEQTGATRVYIFDHTIRRRQDNAVDSVNNRQPVYGAHVDQTSEAAINRVRRHLGDDAERLLKGRVQLINVWRPLFDDNTEAPLAVADFRTIVPERDLVTVKLLYPDYVGETYRVRFHQNHQWYYHSHQNKNDVLLLKCYDSKTGVLTPHTAFSNPKTSPTARPRESIEVRALVFHEN